MSKFIMYSWQVWSYQLTNIFGCQSRAPFAQIILDDFDSNSNHQKYTKKWRLVQKL
jgi:hypothetical protein